jgi:hypothetical protein
MLTNLSKFFLGGTKNIKLSGDEKAYSVQMPVAGNVTYFFSILHALAIEEVETGVISTLCCSAVPCIINMGQRKKKENTSLEFLTPEPGV